MVSNCFILWKEKWFEGFGDRKQKWMAMNGKQNLDFDIFWCHQEGKQVKNL